MISDNLIISRIHSKHVWFVLELTKKRTRSEGFSVTGMASSSICFLACCAKSGSIRLQATAGKVIMKVSSAQNPFRVLISSHE